MEGFDTITKLAELLNVKTYYTQSDSEEEELPDDEETKEPSDVIEGSEDAGELPETRKKEKERENKYRKIENRLTEKDFDIENDNSTCDWKKTPKWDISYKQQVTPSDVFLQMSGKTPSTISCEDMILSIHLPGESRYNIDLKVEQQHLELTSPQFKLSIPLPHPVDPQRGNAKWDKDTQKLIVTLTMDREFDFIHF